MANEYAVGGAVWGRDAHANNSEVTREGAGGGMLDWSESCLPTQVFTSSNKAFLYIPINDATVVRFTALGSPFDPFAALSQLSSLLERGLSHRRYPTGPIRQATPLALPRG